MKLGILFFPEIITGIFCASLIADMCCDDFFFGDSSSKYACVHHGPQNLTLHCGTLLKVLYYTVEQGDFLQHITVDIYFFVSRMRKIPSNIFYGFCEEQNCILSCI